MLQSVGVNTTIDAGHSMHPLSTGPLATMNRRDFLRNSARQAAAAAVPLAGAAIAGGSELYDRFSEQVARTAESLQAEIRQLSASVGGIVDRVDVLEWKYRLVMALLVISLMIDGGMSWMLLTTPLPPVV